MAQISYLDGIALKAICNNACTCIREEKSLLQIIEFIRREINWIQRKADGYWKLPPGREIYIKALNAYLSVLEVGANESILCGIYREFTQVLYRTESKCKVTFLLQEESIWPSTQSVYEAMCADKRFETRLVYVPFTHVNQTWEDENLKIYHSMGLPVVNYTEYDLSKDNPDVVFFAKPYSFVPQPFYIAEVEKIIRHTVYIPYGMEANYRLIRYGFQEYLHYRAWRHIVHGPTVKEIGARYGYRNGENIAVWGHPRADNYLPEKHYEVPGEWIEKINSRKVICWCPHHTIVPGAECVSTWLMFYKTIFKTMERYQDLVLLWRPHPLLFGAIVNNGYMTQAELETLVATETAKNNIILDKMADYRPCFMVSDGMITDGTTFSVEYLYTRKPLMLTTRDIDQFYDSRAAEQALYIGQTKQDIQTFIDYISKGQDPKKRVRDDYCRKTLFIPENMSVGEYIAEQILNDIVEEIRDV